ncbi:MAG: ABC transporter ATP-binding protein, partial [Verrucomicrobiales bacterium]|nr:ABC transporter ATP-binding protein [Verrucomicrobiales bacterium]
LPRPKCLLLDEPTDGLDPEGIREFRELILRLRAEHGLTILLNSHLLAEVELMCDRCVILKAGSKLYEGPVPSRQENKPIFQLQSPDIAKARDIASRIGASMSREGMVELPPHLLGSDIVRHFVEGGIRIDGWQQHRRTLEEFYLEQTGL